MAEASVEQRGRQGEQGRLQPGLKRRHMTMISLGVILVACLLRRAFGPQQRSPEEVVGEEDARASGQEG